MVPQEKYVIYTGGRCVTLYWVYADLYLCEERQNQTREGVFIPRPRGDEAADAAAAAYARDAAAAIQALIPSVNARVLAWAAGRVWEAAAAWEALAPLAQRAAAAHAGRGMMPRVQDVWHPRVGLIPQRA